MTKLFMVNLKKAVYLTSLTASRPWEQRCVLGNAVTDAHALDLNRGSSGSQTVIIIAGHGACPNRPVRASPKPSNALMKTTVVGQSITCSSPPLLPMTAPPLDRCLGLLFSPPSALWGPPPRSRDGLAFQQISTAALALCDNPFITPPRRATQGPSVMNSCPETPVHRF